MNQQRKLYKNNGIILYRTVKSKGKKERVLHRKNRMKSYIEVQSQDDTITLDIISILLDPAFSLS